MRRRILILASVLWLGLLFLGAYRAIEIVSSERQVATKSASTDKVSTRANGQSPSNPAKPASTNGGAPQVASVQYVVTQPQCTPGSFSATPVDPPAPLQTPGLHEIPMTTTYYTVFGADTDEIQNQIYRCSPITEGSHRYAATSSYKISWAFNYSSTSGELCTITAASVGLSTAQQYPTWQPSAGTANNVHANWQRFITNLTTHEMGHATLDRQYAATLLTKIQNFPPTNCATISLEVRAAAEQHLANLNAANETYDYQTNHGATQGATL